MMWKEDLKKFESDNYSGSAELLAQYIELIHYWLEKGELRSGKDRIYLMDSITHLQKTHETLFVLIHFYNQVLDVLQEDNENWDSMLLGFLREYRLTWSKVNHKLALQALSVIDLNQKTVLSHSQSSAVREVFNLYPGSKKKVRLIQTESRPIFEGRFQAASINGLGYDVKLIADAGYSRHLESINMILLGSDAVYKDFFINKTGTYNICLAGKNSGIPIYVLADSRKYWFSLPDDRQEIEFIEEKKPPEELWQDPHPGIDIENYYFEKTPVEWVDGFITETEVLKPSQLESLKKQVIK
jgi:translation initiation factor 2B subunit (eIF-2B alpha/beta/delta family)